MHTVIIAAQWIFTFVILFELFVIFNRINNQLYCHLYILCVSMLVSSYGYLLHLYATTQNGLLLTHLFTWAGRVFSVVCAWRFTNSIFEIEIPKRYKSLDFLIGVIFLFIITTSSKTGFFFSNIRVVNEDDWYLLEYDKGFAYYIWDLVVAVALVIMILRYIKAIRKAEDRNTKKQFLLMSTGLIMSILVAPLAMSFLAKYYDFNQLSFFLLSIMTVVAMIKYNMGDMESLAKELMFDSVSAGIIIMGKNKQSAYYNTVAQFIFPGIVKDLKGTLDRIDYVCSTKEIISVGDKMYSPEKIAIENDRIMYLLNDSTRHYVHIREMEQQKKIAESANKAKSDFLANMSHEIRTPINTVLGMDEMILRESENDAIRGYALDIQTAGRSLLSIINDILDLSKIEAGKMEIVPVEYDVASTIYDVSNMVRFRAEKKDLFFEVEVAPDIPSKLIGDDIRLRQIMVNLLTNAVKYTREGTVWFRVSAQPDVTEEQEDTIIFRCEVEDTGIGIKTEDMDKLFEGFERMDLEQNRNIEGTGLGLAITIKLLKLMGSKLEVSSEYGKGSIFSFSLKQKIADSSPIENFANSIQRYAAEEQYKYTESFVAPDARILLVDDNSMNRRVFSSLLKKTKVFIAEADGGEKSVQMASEQHYDIIFMDHMMPGMDGVEAMKLIKGMDGPCAGIPIIVLTANAIAGAKEQYLQEGFDGFLSKPVDGKKLEKVLMDLLPAEKVERVYATDDEADNTESGKKVVDEEELPIIFGLDWKIALTRLTTMEILDSVLRDFYNTLDMQADKLQGFKDNLPGTFSDYRILVHAMKSSSGSVGIVPLSGMAAILEKAAADEDKDTIDKMHDIFINEWRSYKERLKEYLKTDDEEEKEEISDEMLDALLKMLALAMDEMDIDGADDTIKKLSSFKLPDNLEAVFDKLKAAVSSLDRDATADIINGVMRG